jgi:ribonuclease III
MKAKAMAALEATLGHRFQDPSLLQQALTHSSHAHEASDGEGDHNEQLEFLGDAVLGFVTSRELFERLPDSREGELSKLRAHLVSARHLIQVADQLQLGEYLLLGKGEERSGGRSKSALLVNALEAVIAALYLDAGLAAAARFVVARVVEPELERMQAAGMPVTDFKSALQEAVQSSGRPQPSYVLVKEEGPDHRKTFTVEVRIHARGGGRAKPEYAARAEGPTKKVAEQRAARDALARLMQADADVPKPDAAE